MRDSGFYRYDDITMFKKKVPHTKVLNMATQLLIEAREQKPDFLQGQLLTQAKKALLYAQAEREQDTLADKKRIMHVLWGSVNIVEKKVNLDEALVSYQDIDWVESARQTSLMNGLTFEDMMDGFLDFSRNIVNEDQVPQDLKNHVRILQSIRTQSDALGSLADCRAIG